ncbi:hypothetical protein ACF0H5_014821 [Mactra antiquata]
MGDFNFEFNENASVVKLLKSKLGLNQLISSATTYYESCLDHVYTDIPKRRLKDYGILESYYSDHKMALIEDVFKHKMTSPLERAIKVVVVASASSPLTYTGNDSVEKKLDRRRKRWCVCHKSCGI